MYPSYDDIVSNIKFLIERKEIKQHIIAKRAGFTAQELSDMLHGRRKLIRVENILPLADALEVKLEDLFIPKELQAVRHSLESDEFVPEDSYGKHYCQKGCKPN